MKKSIFFLYLFMLHIAVATAFAYPDAIPMLRANLGVVETSSEPRPFYREMVAYHQRLVSAVDEGAILFIGDSHIQSLHVGGIVQNGFNLGIGGDTTSGVLQRLPTLQKAIEQTHTLVLSVGVNDLNMRSNDEIIANYKKIVSAIPSTTELIVCAVLPVNEYSRPQFAGYNERIKSLNIALSMLTESRPSSDFVDITPLVVDENGGLRIPYQIGDGVHLSRDGYLIWSDAIKTALSKQQT